MPVMPFLIHWKNQPTLYRKTPTDYRHQIGVQVERVEDRIRLTPVNSLGVPSISTYQEIPLQSIAEVVSYLLALSEDAFHD